jgi:hypothetical protein
VSGGTVSAPAEVPAPVIRGGDEARARASVERREQSLVQLKDVLDGEPLGMGSGNSSRFRLAWVHRFFPRLQVQGRYRSHGRLKAMPGATPRRSPPLSPSCCRPAVLSLLPVVSYSGWRTSPPGPIGPAGVVG